ncbi:MAG: 50S ribosomal protein L4 [Planctomycetes bacterium]|nr:50S ribosomal protein L4 [Planctomycetota bacterium]
MVEVKVYNAGAVSSRDVDLSRFGDKVLGRTLKDAVVMYEANTRQGNARTKTRAEIAGPNKKMWKQKHTGRARMGSKKVGHWRGGGKAFGPKPRSYFYQMPVKARRAALRNAIFTKLRDGEVAVADGWPAAPSTKAAMQVLAALGLRDSVLVVTDGPDRNLYLSLRNVRWVDVASLADLNARSVLVRRNMVFTPAAMQRVEANAAAGKPLAEGAPREHAEARS